MPRPYKVLECGYQKAAYFYWKIYQEGCVKIMKISTEIQSISERVGERKAVELCAKAGFDGWDFSMFDMCRYLWPEDIVVDSKHPLRTNEYLKFARELKKIGLDNGIVCNQSHAPFPVDIPEVRSYQKRAIECTAEAGGEICVIHPDNNKSPEENAEMYMELLSFAKDCGVKIATENMWNRAPDRSIVRAACSDPEDFCRHIDILDGEIVACLDIGHAEMRTLNTSAVELIYALGDRLQALHIHDNDCHHDSHQIPFSMDIDFAAIVKALKEIGYCGWFTLEADCYLKKFDSATVFRGVQDLAASAKKLVKMFEEA